MIYNRCRYPDNTVYAEVTDFSNPVITEKINSYEDLFFIKSLKDVCDYNHIKDVKLNIPCMFQQQHDRRFNNNESFELKLVADFINSCNFSEVHIFHPHNESAVMMGIRNVEIIDNTSFIEKVLKNM